MNSLDLFGDHITTPRTSHAKGLLNASHGFVEFWQSWPSGTRKVAKQLCLDKWATKGCAASASLIVQHVEWMKTQEDWTKQNGAFVCAPVVYLNQERWLDWVPVAIIEKPLVDPALEKILRDRAAASAMPAHIRERLAALKNSL